MKRVYVNEPSMSAFSQFAQDNKMSFTNTDLVKTLISQLVVFKLNLAINYRRFSM
jgi:hypothetical protein